MAETEGAPRRYVPVLVCVMGLPASGKTTLCRSVSAHRPDFVHVSFDDLLHKKLEAAKRFSHDDWRESRKEALAAVVAALTRGDCSAVLVDDTFHLRAMRREVFALARHCGAAYAVVHVTVSRECAKARDGARHGVHVVGAEVIDKIAGSEQPPTGSWERHCAPVLTLGNGGVPDATCDESTRAVIQLVETAAATPLVAIEERERQASLDRERTTHDLMHRIDLALRTAVASVVAGLRQTSAACAAGQDPGHAGMLVSRVRARVLAAARAAGVGSAPPSSCAASVETLEDVLGHAASAARSALDEAALAQEGVIDESVAELVINTWKAAFATLVALELRAASHESASST